MLLPKHYKNRLLDNFEKLILGVFGKKFKVNNLATFWANILAKDVAKLLTLKFSHVFC